MSLKKTVSIIALAVAGITVAPLVFAGSMEGGKDKMEGMENMKGMEGMGGMKDMSGMHHKVMPDTTRRIVDYSIPDVTLVREDGKSVSLPKELNDGRPVVLTFIFTTCKMVCPVVSHTLSQLQDKLGPDRDKIRIASISIDPEQDTPQVLAAYAKKYDAGPEWHHYTGTVEASITAQRAFDDYRGDKMNHNPVTFLRSAPGKPWVRLEGFATAKDLLKEVRPMIASNSAHPNISLASHQ